MRKVGKSARNRGIRKSLKVLILKVMERYSLQPVKIFNIYRKYFYDQGSWEVMIDYQRKCLIHLTPKCGSTTLITLADGNKNLRITKISKKVIEKHAGYHHIILHRNYIDRLNSFYREKILNPTLATWLLHNSDGRLTDHQHGIINFVKYVRIHPENGGDKHFFTTSFMRDKVREMTDDPIYILPNSEVIKRVYKINLKRNVSLGQETGTCNIFATLFDPDTDNNIDDIAAYLRQRL